MSLLTVLAALLPGLIPKKAPWCIWVRKDGCWPKAPNNPGGNSARRCGKAVKKFVSEGISIADIMLLPKGINPP
jgi:hypothetical protein